MPHTSRKGWLARWDCYPRSPFACDVDGDTWDTSHGRLSLRTIANRIFERFHRAIARVADPFSVRLIADVVGRRGPTLLTLPERPPAYEDVGREDVWHGRSSFDHLDRSRYERALINAVAGRPLRLFGSMCRPIGVRGWSAVVFKRADGAHVTMPIDLLAPRLDEWERSA
jgi:hypothetical protein